MEVAVKKLLLALDCSSHSRKAAEYVAEAVFHHSHCQVIVLAITTGIPYSSSQVIDVKAGSPPPGEIHGDEDHRQELEEVESFLQEVARMMLDKGLPEERLQVRIKPQNRGIAQDILDEAEAEGCDTIAVGRRGLSKVRALFLGSVSAAVVQQASGRTVWVVE
jgi:nucleotide-binding universal stress UspA family protein